MKYFILFLLYLLSLGMLFLMKDILPNFIQKKGFIQFLISFLISSLVFMFKLKRENFYSTMRHEFCHWLFSLLSFKKPRSFNIESSGEGNFSYYGAHNYYIILAPYFFPIVTFFLLLFRIFFERPSQYYFFLIGITFAFDIVSTLKDYHLQQTDW